MTIFKWLSGPPVTYRPRIPFWFAAKLVMQPWLICGLFLYVGHQIDLLDDTVQIKFRDKSALYGGMKGPGEKPTW